MSLTHYWQRPTELEEHPFAGAVRDIDCFIRECGIKLAGFEGLGEVIVSTDRIVFNGAAPKCCEPFEVARVEFDRRGRPTVYSYCKTQGLPYDLAVKAALIIFNHYFKDQFSVSSDCHDQDWEKARQAVHSVLGYGNEFKLNVE
ncbi:MAG: hypothetical protein ACE37H_03515 [Phycisphaeraceae bacterium]